MVTGFLTFSGINVFVIGQPQKKKESEISGNYSMSFKPKADPMLNPIRMIVLFLLATKAMHFCKMVTVSLKRICFKHEYSSSQFILFSGMLQNKSGTMIEAEFLTKSLTTIVKPQISPKCQCRAMTKNGDSLILTQHGTSSMVLMLLINCSETPQKLCILLDFKEFQIFSLILNLKDDKFFFQKLHKEQMIAKALDFYRKNGYAVIPNFISNKECTQAIKEIDRLIENFQITPDKITVFDTQSRKHDLDEYFKKSADNVSFFFQKKAFENGKLIKPKTHAINKIGHALHQKNEIFRKLTYTRKVSEICKGLNIKSPLVVQSMAILKPPEIGGQVPEHQDSTFLYDEPETLVGFWIPLQDATVNNGCLWGIPGSHKGVLYKRHKVVNGQTFDEILYPKDFKLQDFVPMQMKQGDLAIFSGRFVHRSNENTSGVSRYAYTWHLRDQTTKWSPENWLQREKFPKFPLSDFE